MKTKLSTLIVFASMSLLAQTQTFKYGGEFKGSVSFLISPTVPSKSTPAGDNPTSIATEAQIYNLPLRKVFILDDFGGGINVPASSFDLPLFDICIDYFGFKNWDITWWDGSVFKTVKTEYISSGSVPLRLDTQGGCLNITGSSGHSFNIPVTAELILEY